MLELSDQFRFLFCYQFDGLEVVTIYDEFIADIKLDMVKEA